MQCCQSVTNVLAVDAGFPCPCASRLAEALHHAVAVVPVRAHVVAGGILCTARSGFHSRVVDNVRNREVRAGHTGRETRCFDCQFGTVESFNPVNHAVHFYEAAHVHVLIYSTKRKCVVPRITAGARHGKTLPVQVVIAAQEDSGGRICISACIIESCIRLHKHRVINLVNVSCINITCYIEGNPLHSGLVCAFIGGILFSLCSERKEVAPVDHTG